MAGMRISEADYDRDDWRAFAACRDTDPDLFFPIGSDEKAQEQTEQAKQICGQCAVREYCLAYALTTRQVDGIWGGTSEEERRVMLRGLQSVRARQAG